MLEKQLYFPFYLVILSRYFLEHITVIKAKNQIVSSASNLV